MRSCFSRFYRILQWLPRKKLKNFHGCPPARLRPNLTIGTTKVARSLFMKYAKRCRLRAIEAPLDGLFFNNGGSQVRSHSGERIVLKRWRPQPPRYPCERIRPPNA